MLLRAKGKIGNTEQLDANALGSPIGARQRSQCAVFPFTSIRRAAQPLEFTSISSVQLTNAQHRWVPAVMPMSSPQCQPPTRNACADAVTR